MRNNEQHLGIWGQHETAEKSIQINFKREYITRHHINMIRILFFFEVCQKGASIATAIVDFQGSLLERRLDCDTHNAFSGRFVKIRLVPLNLS